jgi:hypothetical protein
MPFGELRRAIQKESSNKGVTGKRRIPFRQLADAETGVLKVRVDATSGHGARFGSWSPSTAAAFIVLQSRFSGLCPRCRSA